MTELLGAQGGGYALTFVGSGTGYAGTFVGSRGGMPGLGGGGMPELLWA